MFKNNSPLYKYESIKLAENENDWMLYFKSFAKHFIGSFNENYEKLEYWTGIVNKNNDNGKYDLEAIKDRLITYYKMYSALNPQSNGHLEIKKDMLYKFRKITDSNDLKRIKKTFAVLELKKHKFLGDFFTLDELLNITLNFFLDIEMRREFFMSAISLTPDEVSDETLSNLFIQDKNRGFQTIRN